MNSDPRSNIRQMLLDGDEHALLDRAAEIHGHYCPGLASGVKAASIGCRRLDIVHSDGMEEVMAIVECNNCFVDGIQTVAGCTLGNNALIYRDLGKTAVTFFTRDSKDALRLHLLDFDIGRSEEERDEAEKLFDKAVKRREQLTETESERFTELWRQGARGLIDQPEDAVFDIHTVPKPNIPYAPIHNSVICSGCGEKIMETRARIRHGNTVCLACAGETHMLITGAGIQFSD